MFKDFKKINYLIIALFSIILYGVVAFKQVPGELHVSSGSLEAETVHAGRNYYSYLTYSIYAGQVSLLGPYHPDLEVKYDPYSAQALASGVIIMDASYYKHKYYMYWGLAPVLLYVITDVVFGFVPSDIFVSRLILVMTMLSMIIFFARKRNFIAVYIVVLFNPYFISLYLSPTVHSVSRTFAMFALIMSIGMLNRKWNLPALLFSVIAIYCKHNYFAASLLLLLYVSYKNRRQATIYFLVFLLSLIPLLVYNYVRFDEFFEFGIRYITNSGPSVPYGVTYNPFQLGLLIVARFIEYFFTLPLVNGFQILPSSDIYLRVNDWFFSEGNIGVFWSMPILFFFVYDVCILRFKNLSISHLLIFMCFLHFLMLSMFMMTTVRYAYEFLLPLFLMLLVNSERIKITFGKVLLGAYGFIFLMLVVA